MEERFRLRSSSYDPTSRLRLEAIKRQEFEKIRRLESEKIRSLEVEKMRRGSEGRGKMEEGRWTKRGQTRSER